MPIPFDIDSLMHDVMNGWQGCADEDEVHYVGDDYDLIDVVALLSAFARALLRRSPRSRQKSGTSTSLTLPPIFDTLSRQWRAKTSPANRASEATCKVASKREMKQYYLDTLDW